MMIPLVKSGKFIVDGEGCRIGNGVIVDVAEEVRIGNRCVIPDHAYFCGRRIEIGDDFFGYAHYCKRLEIGLGRRDEEDAILKIGSRCTLHDNRIDLAKHVTIGNDVGLSPEVCIYTHFYWLPEWDGWPVKYKPVVIGDRVLIGFRSTVLPGVTITSDTLIGAGSIVSRDINNSGVYAGNPARFIREIPKCQQDTKL